MQALYRWFNKEGELLYVGISGNLHARTKQHQKHAEWFSEVFFCTVEWFGSRYEVQNAENLAIMNENPKHNKTLNKNKAASRLQVAPPDSKMLVKLTDLEKRISYKEQLISELQLHLDNRKETARLLTRIERLQKR